MKPFCRTAPAFVACWLMFCALLIGSNVQAAASAPSNSSASAKQTDLLAQVRQRLLDAPVMRGNFVQTKSVPGFRHPLISSGTFLIARGKGVMWHTLKPFASVLTITRDHLLSRQADGQVTTRVDAKDEPGLRAINLMLFAVMSADVTTLEQRFHITGALLDQAGWTLKLTPRDAMLAQWVTSIELSGDQVVRRVTLVEAQGGSSVITFTDTVGAQTLSTDEARHFE